MKNEYTKMIGIEKVSLILKKIGENEYEIIRNIPRKYGGTKIEEELVDEVVSDADKEGVTLRINIGSIILKR